MGCNCEGCRCGGDITGLSHIGIFVRDIEASLAFYTETLGFECYFKTETDDKVKLAFLRYGTCIIELIQRPVSDAKADGVIDHISLNVKGIDAVVGRLEEKGIEFETERPFDLPGLFANGVRYIMFRGPDGERLELTEEL